MKSALEIAVAALTKMATVIFNDGTPECLACGCEMEGGHGLNCFGQSAREALAAMRAAPGLADDLWLRDIIGNFLSDCGPTLVHQTERCLAAIRVYEAAQREKVA